MGGPCCCRRSGRDPHLRPARPTSGGLSWRWCMIAVQADLALAGGIVATMFSLAFDCSDPDRLTAFWSEALGYKHKDPPAGFDDWRSYFRSIGVPEEELHGATDVYLVDPQVGGGREVPLETRRRRVNAEADRLVGLGATRLRVSDAEVVDHYFVVMQDPEGNEFCVV